MSLPTKAEVSAATEDAERAVFDFASAFADGTLGRLDAADAVALARRASSSVKVAANAFGVDAQEGDTPDALMGRMLGVYAAESAAAGIEDAVYGVEERKANFHENNRAAVRSALGLSDVEVARMDFDAANGDESPWMLANERFVFG